MQNNFNEVYNEVENLVIEVLKKLNFEKIAFDKKQCDEILETLCIMHNKDSKELFIEINEKINETILAHFVNIHKINDPILSKLEEKCLNYNLENIDEYELIKEDKIDLYEALSIIYIRLVRSIKTFNNSMFSSQDILEYTEPNFEEFCTLDFKLESIRPPTPLIENNRILTI